MAEAYPSQISGILGKVIESAPECIRHGVLLKAVDWRGVSPEAVADMLGRIGRSGAPVPLWLAEALLLAGHCLGEARRQDLPPVWRALEAVNAVSEGDGAAVQLETVIAGIAADDAPASAALNMLLRRLSDKGFAGQAAPLAIRYWRQASQGAAALRAAVRHEIEAYPQVALRLLCFSTADILAGDLERAFAACGLKAQVTPKAFTEVWPELLEPGDGCDARLLVLDTESLFPRDGRADDARAEQRIAEQMDALANAVEHAVTASARPLIVSTFPCPVAPAAGYLDGWHPTGLRQAIDSANRRLQDIARRHNQLTIIDSGIALAGIAPAARSDPKLWYYGRLAFSPDASRALAASFAGAWRGLTRSRAKVLALDLDNTLWGGVVGEDGVDGVLCDGEFPGNAYRAFQEECLRLKGQGMLLAILSKNDPQAIETFARRTGMPLKADDFIAARINWRPKPDNIREIAAELNLSLDSFIFIDDSPHERDAMRRMCPAVTAPEMPRDPARRPGWLREMRETWPIQLTREDAQRSEFYAAERKARELRASAPGFEDFLAGLEQQILTAPTDAGTVGRVAQLHARTNQFNLTTRRFDEAALRGMIADPLRYAVMHAQVIDKFGDHGIVMAAVMRFEADTAHIESLLLSCRVIGRRVEYAFISELMGYAVQRGATTVYGEYLPAEKNGIVRDFYQSAGFQRRGESERGSTWAWTISDEAAIAAPSSLQLLRSGTPNERV